MPRKLNDLTGKTFGKLTVICRSAENTKDGKVMWLCRCSCGNTKNIRSHSLLNGHTKSCGKCKSTERPLLVRTHKNRLYHTWSEMIRRCKGLSTNSKYYYGNGISYCEEWKNFDNFAEWAIKNGYAGDLEIDRIEGNKGYSPDNCRWVTHKVNSRNRKTRDASKTGVAGVSERLNKSGTISYRAYIVVDGRNINLGTFQTIDEAKKVRKEAEIKYWGINIVN